MKLNDTNIKRNYIFNLFYQILLIIAPLVVTPYISRVLNPDGIGKISYTESVVAYFVLFATMGITLYGQREISYVSQDKEKRSAVFWNTKLFTGILCIPVIIIYVIFSFFQSDRLLFLVFAVNILNVFFDITWFFQGLENFSVIVLRNTFFKVLSIAMIFLFVKEKTDVLLYAVILSAIPAVGNVSLWLELPKYISFVSRSELHPFANFKSIFSLFIPTVAIQIYTVLDKTMIGVITHSDFENGYYEQAQKVCKLLLTVVSALATVMIPRIGSLFEKDDKDEINRLMYLSLRFACFLGIPICLGVIAVAPNFVPWFFGEGYEKVIPLLRILAFVILAIGFSGMIGMQYLVPTKRQNLLTLSVCVGAVVNFCLNFILIRFYQSIGAAIASVVAETLVTAVQLFIVRKELKFAIILKNSVKYIVSGAVMAVAVWAIGTQLDSSIINTLIMVAAGAVIYFALLLVMKDEFLVSNIKNIVIRLKNKNV